MLLWLNPLLMFQQPAPLLPDGLTSYYGIGLLLFYLIGQQAVALSKDVRPSISNWIKARAEKNALMNTAYEELIDTLKTLKEAHQQDRREWAEERKTLVEQNNDIRQASIQTLEAANKFTQAIEQRLTKVVEESGAKDTLITQQNTLLAEKERQLAEKDLALAEKDLALAEKERLLAEKNQLLAEKERLLAEAQAEIDRLLAELARFNPPEEPPKPDEVKP